MALLRTPETTERSWNNYKALRDKSLASMRNGVLPNIANALDNYNELDEALTNDPSGLFDDEDRAMLAEYHVKAIALVAPAIAGLRQYMAAIEALTQQVDAGFMAAGQAPLFGVRPPEANK